MVSERTHPGAARGRSAAGPAERRRVLESDLGDVRAERLVPVGKSGLERTHLPVRGAGARTPRARRRVRRRGARPELHLHSRREAEDGVHRRHPARQSARAPDVQGADRAVVRPGGLSLAALLQEAARRASPGGVRRGPVRGLRGRRHERGPVPGQRAGDRAAPDPASRIQTRGGGPAAVGGHLLAVLLGRTGRSVHDERAGTGRLREPRLRRVRAPRRILEQFPQLRGAHGADGLGRPEPQLSVERSGIPVSEGVRGEESARAGRR